MGVTCPRQQRHVRSRVAEGGGGDSLLSSKLPERFRLHLWPDRGRQVPRPTRQLLLGVFYNSSSAANSKHTTESSAPPASRGSDNYPSNIVSCCVVSRSHSYTNFPFLRFLPLCVFLLQHPEAKHIIPLRRERHQMEEGGGN